MQIFHLALSKQPHCECCCRLLSVWIFKYLTTRNNYDQDSIVRILAWDYCGVLQITFNTGSKAEYQCIVKQLQKQPALVWLLQTKVMNLEPRGICKVCSKFPVLFYVHSSNMGALDFRYKCHYYQHMKPYTKLAHDHQFTLALIFQVLVSCADALV